MKKAFTLIEIMIVIFILGLLAALVMPNLIGQSDKAKQKLVCIQMKTLADAIKSYRLECGSYPPTTLGLKALITNPGKEVCPNYPTNGFLDKKKLPKDPWGHDYIYIKTQNGFDIISLGSDGKEGGSGENKDIRLSECQN